MCTDLSGGFAIKSGRILLFHIQNGDTAAIQSEIDVGADVEMATSGTTPHKPIFLAFLHDHYQVRIYIISVYYMDNVTRSIFCCQTKLYFMFVDHVFRVCIFIFWFKTPSRL